MKKYFIIGLCILSILFITGCATDYIFVTDSETLNGTVFVPENSFELLSFCSSTSLITNVNPDSLSCVLGVLTDLQFVNGNWSGLCCVFDNSKCASMNTSFVSNFSGLDLSAEHILSSKYYDGFVVTCCNSQGSMCYAPYVDDSFNGCGAGYSEMLIHVKNLSGGNWSVTSCLNGFN